MFIKFPSIENFHNIVKNTNKYSNLCKKVTYRGKIKCDGANVGVKAGVAQSRNQILDQGNTNFGFWNFVEANKEYFSRLSPEFTIFGEWCGPGIMKRTALQKLENKIFVVFAIFGPKTGVNFNNEDIHEIISEPEEISKILDVLPQNMHILPWFGEEFTIDYTNRESLPAVVEHLNKIVEEVEPCDPWVKETFGHEGICEGVVYYPITFCSEEWSNLAFKAKGEKHKVVNTKEAVQLDPTFVNSINEFIDLFVTEGRLEQGLTQIDSPDVKNTGKFLQWFCADVEKESKDELAASNLQWKQVSKMVQDRAKKWYLDRAKVISA